MPNYYNSYALQTNMADAGRNLLLIVMTVFQAIIFKTVCETEVYKKPKASLGDSNFSGKGAPVIASGEAHTRSTGKVLETSLRSTLTQGN